MLCARIFRNDVLLPVSPFAIPSSFFFSRLTSLTRSRHLKNSYKSEKFSSRVSSGKKQRCMNNAGGVRVTTVFYYTANGYSSINENRSGLVLCQLQRNAKGASAARPYALIEATIQLAILSWFVPIPRKMGRWASRCDAMRCGAARYSAVRGDAAW